MSLSKRNTAKGFTLIELLIVLVLIGLSSSFVLPSMWQQLEQTKYRSEVLKAKGVFDYCKHYAFYRNQVVEVSVKDNRFVIKTQDDSKVLKEIVFETFSFKDTTLYFDKTSSFNIQRLTIVRNNGSTSVELEI
jgi:prepilin-type N-terminal cleavage/methylation domain-containing protein